MSVVDKADIEMDGLTPEERAALQDMHDNPEDTTATVGDLEVEGAAAAELAAEAPPAKEPKNEPAQAEEGASAGAAAAADTAPAAAAPADGAKPAEAAAAEPAATPSAAPQPAPVLVAQAPADAEAKLAEIATKRADLHTKYDAGEITFNEYEDQKDALVEEKNDLQRAVERATIAAELNEQQKRNEWSNQCDAFLKVPAHAAYNTDKELFDHLNETIRAIAVMPRNQNLTGPQLLEKAHKLVQAERGEAPAAAPAQAAAPAAGAAKPAAPAPAPKLPPNLAHIPAASGTETGDSRFSALDRLQETDPMGYEAALAKLSESEQSAYLAA